MLVDAASSESLSVLALVQIKCQETKRAAAIVTGAWSMDGGRTHRRVRHRRRIESWRRACARFLLPLALGAVWMVASRRVPTARLAPAREAEQETCTPPTNHIVPDTRAAIDLPAAARPPPPIYTRGEQRPWLLPHHHSSTKKQLRLLARPYQDRPSLYSLSPASSSSMSATCGNCDCADKTQCT